MFFSGIPVPSCTKVALPPNSCLTSLGGPIHHSDQLPTNVLTGNICIQGGNFFITSNSTFTFQNATIIIAPNAEIVVEEGAELILDNATLKGCEGLWRGIRLSNYSSILTTNNTYIEGARKAISASYVNATLDIENTTFNRNLTGIWLEDSPNSINPPNISYITNATFMCNGQIPGTTNQLSDNGIYSLNCPVSFKKGNEPDDNNLNFSNLKYGIKIEGEYSNKIKGNNFYFHEIYYSAIFMNRGVIELNQSTFVNFGQSAIVISLVRGITLNGCNFKIVESDPNYILNPTALWRTAITLAWDYYFPQIVPNIYIHNDNVFNYNCPTSNDIYAGIVLGGMGAKFNAYISKNNFIEYGRYCKSIHINGDYSDKSVLEIFDNDFSTACPENIDNSNYFATGIYSSSNLNNVHISGNRFQTSGNDGSIGVSITNSMGFNNIISGNRLYSKSQISVVDDQANAGVVLANAYNFKICSNYSFFGGRAFYFVGDNLGTGFSLNEFVGSGFDIDGRIGAQEQKDNKFYTFILETYSRCLSNNCGANSLFSVRQPIGSEYYPLRQICGYFVPPPPCVDPFFKNIIGTQQSSCLSEIIAPGEEDLLLDIADDDYPKEYPSNKWYFENFLYSKLKHDTLGILQNVKYSNFMHKNYNSEIGILYRVDSLIKKGLDGGIGIIDTNILKTALNINTSIVSINPFANKQKTVNEIIISTFLRQEKDVPAQNIQILKDIANECYTNSGPSVSQANVLLTGCDMILKNPVNICGSIYRSPLQLVPVVDDRENQSNTVNTLPFKILNAPDNITLVSSKISNGEIYLSNVSGQILYTKNIRTAEADEEIRIDTGRFPNGLYFLTFRNDQISTVKINIQH